MSNITITMRDGTVRDFPHKGRSGGSYTKSVRYEGGMVIVCDEWDHETAIPMDLVAEVVTTPNRSW